MSKVASHRGRSLGRSALVAISMMLFASAAIRFGSGPAVAIANEFSAPIAGETATTPAKDLSEELARVLEEVMERQKRLDDREAAIDARMQVLSLVEEGVAADIERLEEAEAALRATLSTADQAAENDIARLTSVYENMKSEQAAELFERMEPTFAAGFLGRMRADAAAAILAGLEPELAYSISVVLAGRNADVVREPVPE